MQKKSNEHELGQEAELSCHNYIVTQDTGDLNTFFVFHLCIYLIIFRGKTISSIVFTSWKIYMTVSTGKKMVVRVKILSLK